MISNNKYSICTIIAKNYISFARTLCNSFLKLHPEGKCYVLIIDSIEGYLNPETENFEIIKLDNIGIQNLREFCFKYNIIELSTALKPYLLKYLLDFRSINKILYLDPDILVTNRLDSLYEELDKYDFIITPHLNKDYPDDGLLPNDATIMKHGIFNLGFIGVRKCENSSKFLLWWQHKLYDKCLINTANGYFVDQKFIDLAITLFNNYKIIYDVGYNVAFWNLHSRSISYIEDKWCCNDGILYFYHFSSYKPETPNLITSNQTRYTLEDSPELRSLYSEYYKILVENGYFESNQWPYTYNYFNNGELVNDFIRWVYRHCFAEKKSGDPFNINGYTISNRVLFIFLRLCKKGSNLMLKLYKKYFRSAITKYLL